MNSRHSSDEIDLSKREVPQKEYVHPLVLVIFNYVEKLIAKFSIHEDVPIYENDLFPWVPIVEKNWQKIRTELDLVMNKREELPSFHEIMDEVKNITTDNNWKTFFLAGYGLASEENSKRCPETTKILNKIPGMKTAFFSILSPKKHIPQHRGPYNGVLRLHLGLIVPEPREQCRIRIGDDVVSWEEGKCLIFDDTFNHEVWNDTNSYRVVLFVDFIRPLKFPFNILNSILIKYFANASFIKEAEKKHKQWEKEFYKV
ncbi:MAG: aspartyl/asparaginyl beta-hydroxylase domain-containing protein [Candidatus Dadabacteria bacterium]|nr:aspartyl/asparaginyl beta-hydroxylase domain-containing protein [Candidatus Dadabacteria bacterium]NIQ14354.1 aspartyl/asparaginyl beta-hydroxylase domain-containing protein [Candidatus Dadabacteria bacterium]